MDKQAEFIQKFRDADKIITEALIEYIEFVIEKKKSLVAAALEHAFTILYFEPQQGAKLGEFEVANKTSNLPDKWNTAYHILKVNNATIKERYHDEGYQYSYWLFGQEKIYRQKLKPKE